MKPSKSIFEQSGLKGKNTELVNIYATFKIATKYKIVVFYWETPLYIDSFDIKSWLMSLLLDVRGLSQVLKYTCIHVY